MFVGISVSELLNWWGPVVKAGILPVAILALALALVPPILGWCWSYINRSSFKNTLQRRVAFLFCSWMVKTCPTYKGRRISRKSWADVKSLLNGDKKTVNIYVSDDWVDYFKTSVNCDGSVEHKEGFEKVTVSRVNIQMGIIRYDGEPLILLASVMVVVGFLVWPLFLIAAAGFIPLYLLRAARDGQKLAIKVKNHIADKEAHKGE